MAVPNPTNPHFPGRKKQNCKVEDFLKLKTLATGDVYDAVLNQAGRDWTQCPALRSILQVRLLDTFSATKWESNH